jgi:glycerol-3-phosphate O-acyltransferase
LWTQVFSGVDVPPADIERIRSAMRHGTAVLIPCHKSHFDYVLLSWVLYDHGIVVPHVVAGRNLAVWPVSVLLRGAGGFFVPRTFVGLDPVVQSVFSRYLRELVLQEYPVEFFIEGGRSRSGKLQPPKLGVLGMVLDAAELRAHGREVTLLPIGLAYEQVAEEKAYARELGGEPKAPESLGQLAKSRSVLRRRFGRVHLRVAPPIPCGPIVDSRPGLPAWSARPDDERRTLLQALGARVVVGMGRATVVLPTSLAALALLAHHRRAIRADDLRARVQRFDRLITAAGLPRAPSLERLEVAISHALDRFVAAGRIRSVGDGEERVWDVDPDQRITLDFYKNQVLHALAPGLLASAVLRAAPDNAGTPGDLAARFAWLVARLRREFVVDPDVPTADLLAAGLGQLAFHGAVVEEDGRWRVSDRARIAEIHGLVRPLLEAHLAVIELGPALPLTKEQIPPAVLAARGGLSASGVVTRPESLSVVTLKNVVGVLVEDGVLVERDGRLVLDAGAAEGHVTEMNAMVGR